jgi:hypothetical protein
MFCTSKDSLYMTHSASFHSSFQHESIRAMPKFKKQDYVDQIQPACMRILSQESFQAPFDSFQDTELKGRDHYLKVCSCTSKHNMSNSQ